MYDTHTPGEWTASFLPGIGSVGVIAFALAFAGADAAYFDPRRPVAALLNSGRLDALLIAIVSARTAVRDAVLDTAALVLLLTTSPNGATR